MARQKDAGTFSLTLPFGALILKMTDFTPPTEWKVRHHRIAARQDRCAGPVFKPQFA